MRLCDVGGDGLELRGCARDEEEVVAGFGKLFSELLANAIAGAGDESPGATRAEAAELYMALVHDQSRECRCVGILISPE